MDVARNAKVGNIRVRSSLTIKIDSNIQQIAFIEVVDFQVDPNGLTQKTVVPHSSVKPELLRKQFKNVILLVQKLFPLGLDNAVQRV